MASFGFCGYFMAMHSSPRLRANPFVVIAAAGALYAGACGGGQRGGAAPVVSPAAQPVAREGNPVAADARSLGEGRTIYVRECQSCHGAGGRGDGGAARDFRGDMPDLTDADVYAAGDRDLYDIVTKGHKPMPAFRERLGEKQRWDVVNYVRAAFAPRGGGT